MLIIKCFRRLLEEISHWDKCGVLEDPLSINNFDHLLEPFLVDKPESVIELPLEVADYPLWVEVGVFLIEQAIKDCP